jgi:hypothetical protein
VLPGRAALRAPNCKPQAPMTELTVSETGGQWFWMLGLEFIWLLVLGIWHFLRLICGRPVFVPELIGG